MTKKIEISQTLYENLESLVKGFETPQDIIQRLLSHYQQSNSVQKKPSIFFLADSEEAFKEDLVNTGKAWRAVIRTNNVVDVQIWNAKRFTKKSSLQGNLWSGILRNWKNDGIKGLVLSTDRLPSDYGTLMNLIDNSLSVAKSKTTRQAATKWIENSQPRILDQGFKTSKHFSDHERWFFTFNADILEKDGVQHLLLAQPENVNNFLLLSIPNEAFIESRNNLVLRNQNGKQVFDIYISSKKEDYLSTASDNPIDLTNYLVGTNHVA